MLRLFLVITVALGVGSVPANRGYELKCGVEDCVIEGKVPIRDRNIVEEDIIVDDDEIGSEGRNSARNPDRRWPNGIVYYAFHKVFNQKQRKMIREAMDTIEAGTCIKFVPVNRQNRAATHLSIVDEKTVCSAQIGYQKSKEHVIVNYHRRSCFRHLGALQHELIHALGYQHEQSRPDRDDYVIINKKNIKPDHLHNFNKNSEARFTTFGLPYNYESVMHYGAYAFAIDKTQKTIISRDPNAPAKKMGQRVAMNELDFKMLNLRYCSGNRKQ